LNIILAIDPDDLDAINRMGHIHRLRGQLDDARAAYQRVYDLADGDQARAAALGNMGIVAQTRGDLDEAMRLHKQAYEINQQLEQLEGQANALGNMGIVAEIKGDLDEARRLWIESRDLFVKLDAKHMVEKVRGWIDGLDAGGDEGN
jgi:tetratricopeptide (TPR) repeat protein